MRLEEINGSKVDGQEAMPVINRGINDQR